MSGQKTEIVVLGATPDVDAQLLSVASITGTVISESMDLLHYRDWPAGQGDKLVIVYVDGQPGIAFKAVLHLAAAHPETPVIVLSASTDANHVLQAMRSGARDYAVLDPTLEDIVRAVSSMIETRAGGSDASLPRGKVVSVIGAKGGAGATMIAANLAGMSCRQREKKTLLLDLDLQLGDCLAFLDLECRGTLSSAIHNLQRLDAELLRGLSSLHPSSGVHVLAQSDRIEEAEEATPEKMGRLIRLFQQSYELVVIDGIRPFDDMAITAIDASDQVIVVFTPDVPSVKNAKRCLSILEKIAFRDERVLLVLNRHEKRSKLDAAIIAQTIGRPIDAAVANDFSTAMISINRGLLLDDQSPGSKIARDVAQLLDRIHGPIEPEKQKVGLGARIRSLFAPSAKAGGETVPEGVSP